MQRITTTVFSMCLVLTAGCGGGSADPADAMAPDSMPSDGPPDGPADNPRPVMPDDPTLWADCADAPLLGVAGASASDRFEAMFRWEDGWSVTDPIAFRVASDVAGVAITIELAGADTGLAYIENNGEVLLDINRDDPELEGIAPFFHVPQRSGSIAVPMDDELTIEGGCLTLIASGLDDLSGQTAEVFVSTKRGERSRMDITAVVVGETTIDENEVRAALTATNALYDLAGAGSIGDVEVISLDREEPFVDAETDDIYDLRASVVGDDPGRLNVFFIQDFYEEGTAGIAAGVPGPVWVHGTSGSGVIISVDNNLDGNGETVDIDLMASVIAHEVAHQFGLFHSSESGGSFHDELDDTAACTSDQDVDGDGELSADECIDHGGRNFMFWTGGDYDQSEISPSQARIISVSPVMR